MPVEPPPEPAKIDMAKVRLALRKREAVRLEHEAAALEWGIKWKLPDSSADAGAWDIAKMRRVKVKRGRLREGSGEQRSSSFVRLRIQEGERGD